ncbi:hypothetical protein L3N51_02196 [Metallosphaera sp. J1]|uniref:hypothetical protein n=1 Tax=Metallosphaera TaxID=41980 RepID=UPI001EDDB0EE|nr:hypothetical protein [Metallosphaera javensis (ex Hofmann et al. 2022)]MCG3109899.1 hypothetical protein [Metallosphaera javensis (ex Hofmann et al. 2022)]BCS93598.1 MAG: hypothetical protein MjAS7_2206 [Metallosphaera javensis (ex Sakai et al. 2022)]
MSKERDDQTEEWTIHKGLINVSDTVIYILGWVFLFVGLGVDVLGVNAHSGSIVAVGIGLNWIGIILAFGSGAIGNRKIPPGYGEK